MLGFDPLFLYLKSLGIRIREWVVFLFEGLLVWTWHTFDNLILLDLSIESGYQDQRTGSISIREFASLDLADI